MPIRFRYHPERDLLIHVGKGRVGIEDIQHLREHRREAGVPRTVRSTLTDMRQAEFDFDVQTLRKLESGQPADEYVGARHAEVVTGQQSTALLLLWKEWLPDGIHVEVFSTVEAAYEWLDVVPHAGDLDF